MAHSRILTFFEGAEKMETGKRGAKIVASVLVLAGFFALALIAGAGSLEPGAPPGPTMKTMDQLYGAATSGVLEREGYCTTVTEAGGVPTNILTVPAGKRFVLLRIYVQDLEEPPNDDGWQLLADSRLLIDGAIVNIAADKQFNFPDRCVAVEAGETLKLDTKDDAYEVLMTVIGYYYNIQ
jgi:hypothetical protein